VVQLLGYVESIRRRVGHDLIMTIGCGAIVEDRDRRLLLQRRRDSGLWAIPGGLVEPGEAIVETVRREVLEETGRRLGELALFGVYSGPEGYAGYPNGDKVFSVQLVLRTVLPDPRLRPTAEEALDHRFFARADFPTPEEMHRHQRRILADWLSEAPGPFLR
jgi:8-oxo-dGTP pyrophosphatase MutT (NUDIX family)